MVAPAAFVTEPELSVRLLPTLMPGSAVELLVNAVMPVKSPPDTISDAVLSLVNVLS
jgi:hypothetical protein